jgi:hypothetical protein
MSASTMTSAVSVLGLGIEVSPAATPAHSPHGGEASRGAACVKPAFSAPRAVVSLDTSRAPAMLHSVGMRLFAGESQ